MKNAAVVMHSRAEECKGEGKKDNGKADFVHQYVAAAAAIQLVALSLCVCVCQVCVYLFIIIIIDTLTHTHSRTRASHLTVETSF